MNIIAVRDPSPARRSENALPPASLAVLAAALAASLTPLAA